MISHAFLTKLGAQDVNSEGSLGRKQRRELSDRVRARVSGVGLVKGRPRLLLRKARAIMSDANPTCVLYKEDAKK